MKTHTIFLLLWLFAVICVIAFTTFEIFLCAKIFVWLMWTFWLGMVTSKYIDKFIEKIKTSIKKNKSTSITEDDEELTIKKYLDLGVNKDKIIFTVNPSTCIWSLTRKCIVGGKNQPESLEVIIDTNNNSILTGENNRIVSLQVRTILSGKDIIDINSSDGIIVTNATYGEPRYRYGFIPTV